MSKQVQGEEIKEKGRVPIANMGKNFDSMEFLVAVVVIYCLKCPNNIFFLIISID